MKPAVEQKLLLTVTETAGLLSLSRPSVYQLIQSGRLPVFRIGKAVRVSREDLEHTIKNRSIGDYYG